MSDYPRWLDCCGAPNDRLADDDHGPRYLCRACGTEYRPDPHALRGAWSAGLIDVPAWGEAPPAPAPARAGLPAGEFQELVDRIGRLSGTSAAVAGAWRTVRQIEGRIPAGTGEHDERVARAGAAWDRLIVLLDELDELVGVIEADRAVRLFQIAADESGPAG